MSILFDLPELQELARGLQGLQNQLAAKGWDKFPPRKLIKTVKIDELPVLNQILSEITQIENSMQGLVSNHKISNVVEKALADSIKSDLGMEKIKEISVDFLPVCLVDFWRTSPAAWFERTEDSSLGILDTRIEYAVYHPYLLVASAKFWAENSKVNVFQESSFEELVSSKIDRLKKYGIPAEIPTWTWAEQALAAVEEYLCQTDIDARLCDLVSWTCTKAPAHVDHDVEYSAPKFFRSAVFGERLADDFQTKSPDGPLIWDSSENHFVTPLWEYFLWAQSGTESQEHEWRYLADIGAGIEAAVCSRDLVHDKADDSPARLISASIFGAGEAYVRLRIKRELEETIHEGHRARRIERTRTQKAGMHSTNARNARISALIEQVEILVRDNQILATMDPMVAARKAQEISEDLDPTVWSQGKGQIEEYINEVRRGEAGPDLKERYEAIFSGRTRQKS